MKGYYNYEEKRIYSTENFHTFNFNIENTNWYPLHPNNQIFATKSPNDTYDIFFGKFYNAFNNSFPKQKTLTKDSHLVKPKLTLPWMSKTLLKACRKKSRLLKIYNKTKSDKSKLIYTRYKNTLKQILRNEEKRYYENEFKVRTNNIKATWSLINSIVNKQKSNNFTNIKSLIIKGKKVTNNQDIVENLNEYFTNVGAQLSDNIPKSSLHYTHYLKQQNTNTMMLFPTSEEEVTNILNSLETKASYGEDEIPTTVLKSVVAHISPILTLLVNHSLKMAIFPDTLKIAKIIPIYKANSRTEMSNYRPISLLNTISKVYEKTIQKRLDSFITKNNILYSNQYGFRKSHSTDSALTNLLDKITEAQDKNEQVISIFVDLAKAFDTVDHKILLSKLYHYGIRGPAYNLLSNYLTNRQQFVQIGNACSIKRTVTHGVPQGSILGPVLFLIYINDMHTISSQMDPILFADDTTLTYSNKKISALTKEINKDLSQFNIWLQANKLSLNINKTNFIFFRTKRTQRILPNIMINEIPIKKVSSIKILGVEIDETLTWKAHMLTLRKKLATALFFLKKIRPKVNTQTALMYYDATVHSHLNYCCTIWGNACITHMKPIISLQKRCLKLCLNLKSNTKSCEIYTLTGKMKVTDICKAQTAKIIFKFFRHQDLLPNHITNTFQTNAQIHQYKTRQCSNLGLFNPPCNINIRKSVLRIYGPTLWNSIPDEIKNSSSLKIFNKAYKKYLIERTRHQTDK